MIRKLTIKYGYLVVTIGLVLGLVGAARAATGNSSGYAWGTNIGWLNFAPKDGGATVYSDHREGYVWAENIGWIRLGSHTGGSPHSYANSTQDNYGVNHDGQGVLSGYAWSTSAGWINFKPRGGGVTIDLATGSFRRYAWAENVGWIHF